MYRIVLLTRIFLDILFFFCISGAVFNIYVIGITLHDLTQLYFFQWQGFPFIGFCKQHYLQDFDKLHFWGLRISWLYALFFKAEQIAHNVSLLKNAPLLPLLKCAFSSSIHDCSVSALVGVQTLGVQVSYLSEGDVKSIAPSKITHSPRGPSTF